MNAHDILVPLLWVSVGLVIAGIGAMLKGLPKKWVDSWIDNRFKLKQDELNHEFQTKLEGVRSEIQRTFSRVSKVHEQEYKVLPQAWFYLQAAYGTSFRTVNGIMSRVRFASMSEA